MSLTQINIDTWKRKDVFHFFKNYDNPYYNICSKIEVDRLYHYCKAENLSFNLALIHSTLKTINDLEEFKMRIEENKVYQYDTINCGMTVLAEDETFSFCYFDYIPDQFLFIENSKKIIEQHKINKKFDPRENVQNLIYFSVLPWINFSSISHAKRFNTGDSIPLITFGKLHTENSNLKIPISIEVNHALVDGIHVGKLLNNIQEIINKF